MTKQEFLAASLPYELILLGNYEKEEYTAVLGGIHGKRYYDPSGNEIEDFKPIIRPLDSLTQECVQSDYNGGKPFVPIVELAKISGIAYNTHNYVVEADYRGYILNIGILEFVYNIYGDFFCSIGIPYARVDNQLQLFQQLLKWHFWPNMPEGEEVVYVNENFNPYK